jgi:hypothetical protein
MQGYVDVRSLQKWSPQLLAKTQVRRGALLMR